MIWRSPGSNPGDEIFRFLTCEDGTPTKVLPAVAMMGCPALTAEDHLGHNLLAADLTVDVVDELSFLGSDKFNTLGAHEHGLIIDSQGPANKLFHTLEIVAADLFAN